MRWVELLVVALASASLIVAAGCSTSESQTIHNVHTVTPGVLIRGSQPTYETLRELRDDFGVKTVVNFNDVGTAMLQDHVFARESWLAEEGNEDIAVRFLRASFRGWMFCRDNFDACVQHVLDNGPTLGEGHMRWMLNEINALIWPSPQGIGILDEALYQQTVDISTEFGVIAAPPDEGAVRTDLALAAHEGLEGDLTGEGWQRMEIEVTPGGE